MKAVMTPELANPGSVIRRVSAKFEFGTRMLDLAVAELGDGKHEAARKLIYAAIEHLDGAAGIIWEFEQHVRGQGNTGPDAS